MVPFWGLIILYIIVVLEWITYMFEIGRNRDFFISLGFPVIFGITIIIFSATIFNKLKKRYGIQT